VHELDGPNLSGFRNEDVNLKSPVPVVDTTYRLAAEPVATTRLDTRYYGVGAGQEQGGVNELVGGRMSGEEHDDSRKYPLPGTAFEAAPVDRPLTMPKSNQFAHGCHTEGELCT
jgi:hypothetical protein